MPALLRLSPRSRRLASFAAPALALAAAAACSGGTPADSDESGSGGSTGGSDAFTGGSFSDGGGNGITGGTTGDDGNNLGGGMGGMGGGTPHAVLPRPIEVTGEASELLVWDRTWGGFSERAFAATGGLPSFALYADGTVLLGPANAFSYELRQMRISEEAAISLLTSLDDAGLYSHSLECVEPLLADAPDRTLDLFHGSLEQSHHLYPPDCDDVPALTEGTDALERYQPPTEEMLVEDEAPLDYAFVTYQVSPTSGDDCNDADDLPAVFASALEDASGDCLEFTRDEAPFTPEEPDSDTRYFTHDEACLRLDFRPVLPHEVGCGPD